MIGAKTIKLGCFHKHLTMANHRKQKAKRVMVTGLMLTSMVDMFSLLVIFLLQSFSNSPQVIELNKGVALPAAISGTVTIDAPVLAVSADEIMLDHKLVGSTMSLIKVPEPLVTRLQQLRNVWVTNHPKEKFTGEIHIQADKDLSASLVSEYMSLLISQGYTAIQLAVVSNGAK